MAGITQTPPTQKKSAPFMAQHRHYKSARTTKWRMFRDVDSEIGDYISEKEKKNKDKIPKKIDLTWFVNPSECQWKVGTRTYIEKIHGGAVHHEWPQTGDMGNESFRNSRLDQPMLSISFQSGIITKGGYSDILDTETDVLPLGLGNFYDFLDMLDQPNMKPTGEPNYVNLLYISPIFGRSGIYLKGFFTEDGVSWTDTAEDPNQITAWGATFIVHNCRPTLITIQNMFSFVL